MLKLLFRLSCLAVIGLSPASGLAASSLWHQAEGGRIRLVTTGAPDEDGRLRGALQIELLPGWKTYWRDPGDAGVPPQISFPSESEITVRHVHFPAPTRFKEGNTHWAGYDSSVSFALDLGVPTQSVQTTADIFLGLCQSICVPVQARLNIDISQDRDDIFDRAIVSAAFDSAPEPASGTHSITSAKWSGQSLIFGANLAASAAEPQLFIETPAGFRLAEPKWDGQSFSVPVLSSPSDLKSATFTYTLVVGNDAANGTVALH